MKIWAKHRIAGITDWWPAEGTKLPSGRWQIAIRYRGNKHLVTLDDSLVSTIQPLRHVGAKR